MEIDAILKLIETDEKVRKHIQDVHEERRQLKMAVEEEKKQISKEAWDAVHETLAKTKSELDEKIRRDDEQNEKYYEAASRELQSLYDAKCAKWRKEIYNRVLHDEVN